MAKNACDTGRVGRRPFDVATVLVVEDDPQTRELYRHALLSARYRVTVAADGYSALRSIERNCPDLLVLDLHLPRVSGWDVYRDVRSRWTTAKLPIIAVSGYDFGELRAGEHVSLLEKPIDPTQLIAAADAIRRDR